MTYVLHTEDPFGHASDRRVADAQTAASLIESWVLPEDEPLLVPRPRSAPVPATPSTTQAATAALPAPWSLTGALEISMATDGSVWLGGTATGCVRLGRICLGARARSARDDDLGGEATDFDLSRTSAEVLAIAALPLSTARLTLTPIVGAGAGWTRTTVAPSPDVDVVSSSAFGLRAETAFDAGWFVTQHLSLIGELGVSFGRPSSSTSDTPLSTGIMVVAPPAAQVRLALGCQYTP